MVRVANGTWEAMTAGEIREIAVRGVRLRMHCSSELERWRLETFESKEPDLLDWLERVCVSDGAFYDVGSNIGQYALFVAQSKPDTQVVAFEPAPQNLARLSANVWLNDAGNVHVCGLALAARTGLALFHLSSLSFGSSMHALDDIELLIAFGETRATSISVGASTLDDVVEHGNLPAPTVLKIDVDGSELDVLDGAARTLESEKLRHVMVEANWTELNATRAAVLNEFLMARGFTPISTGGSSRRHRMNWQNMYYERLTPPS